jgi:hypothetical protein
MIPSSIFKKSVVSGTSKFFHSWLNWIFPPLCTSCSEICSTCFFCPSCWDLCAPADPFHRCRHCFQEMEDPLYLCKKCQDEPHLPFPYAYVFERNGPTLQLCQEIQEIPEAIAAFMLYQWVQLNWLKPEVIIPMPKAKALAKWFAFWLDLPYYSLLSMANHTWECDVETIEEDQILLLLDVNSHFTELQKAVSALSETFPKRIYILSLCVN